MYPKPPFCLILIRVCQTVLSNYPIQLTICYIPIQACNHFKVRYRLLGMNIYLFLVLSIDYEDEDSDSDVPPEPPRQTKSGRLTQKPKVYVPIIKYSLDVARVNNFHKISFLPFHQKI